MAKKETPANVLTAREVLALKTASVRQDCVNEIAQARARKNSRIACIRSLRILVNSFGRTEPKRSELIKQARTVYCNAFGLESALYSNRAIESRLKTFIKDEISSLHHELFSTLIACLND